MMMDVRLCYLSFDLPITLSHLVAAAAPITQIAYYEPDNALILVGDLASFNDEFGASSPLVVSIRRTSVFSCDLDLIHPPDSCARSSLINVGP
jgi:hypothetical protein